MTQQPNHTLKCDPAIFRAVRDGRKRFDIRKDDRAFQCGDLVTLVYHDPVISPMPSVPEYRPFNADDPLEPLTFRIGFVLRGGQYGLEPGYVAFQIEPVTPT